MRNRFDEQLDTLEESMEEMGTYCKDAINSAVEALVSGNEKKAQDVIAQHSRIRRMERDIENICLKLLMQQQPVATDLRIISSSLKAVYDLDRIGDVARDIADIVVKDHVTCANTTLHIHEMANAASAMVDDSIRALTTKDEKLARSVIDCDDIVDNAFKEIKSALPSVFSEKTNVEYALNVLMIAKYFEKIGDHAVNIAKWAIYVSTGEVQ